MTKLRQCAEMAAVALAEKRRAASGDIDLAAVADIIEQVLDTAVQEREEVARQRIAEEQAAARERLTQLLSASPAVIYGFKASGNYVPTFVSVNIETLFGYARGNISTTPISGASASTLTICTAWRPQ